MPRRPGLGRVIHRNRRVLAALCAGLTIVTLGAAFRPPPAATRSVVVAARDLPTGHRLAAEDLGTAPIPTTVALPGASPDAAPLLGRVLAAPLVRGEAVTTARLMAPAGWAVEAAGSGTAGVGVAAAAGTVPLPVRFPDAATVQLLATGQRIDVLATPSAGSDAEVGLNVASAPVARVVARGATVLAVTGPAIEEAGLMGGSSVGEDAPLVVLGVTEPQALAIAGAAVAGRLAFTLVSTVANGP